ncbi:MULTISPECIES: RNA polymerase sigma-70 factor [Reichenbachiella]|uniref:RNA polymerase sigma-70 factor n=1 Tax=Reichenbachiella TaxID=156993 RepID=UPI000E6B7095|nr:MULTISPECIES: RNA polymerase sigma-70 factor [Reichenbachiella]MBU2913563.1 RNA polymerase sigma-70 factor [Reichenbachiella agariperforans]RJE74473.1 hypothetical protein BGP76_15070 [Reichenbachiella sp. MSK19-1]
MDNNATTFLYLRGMPTAAESKLIDELNNGEVHALNQLFDEHFAAMIRCAYTLTKNKEVSEELTQDVFISIWNKRGSFHIEGSFRPYLVQAVRYRCYTYFKRGMNQETIEIDHLTDPASSHTADMAIHSSDLKEGIALALSALPDKTKAVFLMSREDELSYQEIAQHLDISLKTVEYHMGKALKTLKKNLTSMGFFTLLFAMLFL